MEVVNSWAKAISIIEHQLSRGLKKAVSFDVFDTLLIRKTTPEFVEIATIKRLSEMLKIDEEAVREARRRAWDMECAKSISKGYDHEVKVEDHFYSWVRLLSGHNLSEDECRDLSRDILSYEIEVEKLVLKPNREILAYLLILKSRNVPVIAMSDMYLTSGYISDLLNFHGFDDLLTNVISSADIYKQKRTGNLFKEVEKYGYFNDISSDQIIHVGDHTFSDGVVAKENGIESIVVHNPVEMYSRQERHFSSKNDKAKSVSDVVMSQDLVGLSATSKMGAGSFGPIYSGFIHSVASRAVEDGVASVWFLAREGWMLHEMYKALRDADLEQHCPPSGYLYVSRLSTMRANLKGFREAEFAAAGQNTASRTLGNLLAPLGIERDELAAVLDSYDFDIDDIVDDEIMTRFEECGDLQKRVEKIGQQELKGLKKYLVDTGFPMSGKVAIVDVGWGGQIQENLEKALLEMGATTKIIGYYMATNNKAEDRRRNGSIMVPILANSMDWNKPGVGAFSFVQGFEMITRSPHGSVLGYTKDGKPLLDDSSLGRRSEEFDDPFISKVQIGILEFANFYFKYASLIGISKQESVSLARDCADRISLFPKKAEAEFMIPFNAVANLGMDEGHFLGGKFSPFRFRRIIEEVNWTPWSEGSAAYSIPFFGPLVLLWHKNKVRTVSVDPKDRVSLEYYPEEYEDVRSKQKKVKEDILDLNITDIRFQCASGLPLSFSKKKSLFSLLDLISLYLIARMNGYKTSDGKIRIKNHIKSHLRYVLKHPNTELFRYNMWRLRRKIWKNL